MVSDMNLYDGTEYDDDGPIYSLLTGKSCGESLPSTATVTLCGFIDRSPIPACAGGQPGYADAFNQTVQLTLEEPVDVGFGVRWIGELSLPEGYYQHKLTLSRGTQNTGDGCQGAGLVLQGVPSSFGCVNVRWTRNYNSGDLPGYSTWTFGPNNSSTQLRTQTLTNISRTSTATCQITFS
jgi:hypothetical protein